LAFRVAYAVFASGPRIPVTVSTSLSPNIAITRCRRSHRNASAIAVASAPAASGLCAPSRITSGWRAITSSRPGVRNPESVALLANDPDPALLDDPGLLGRDLANRGPQDRGVVEPDRAEHRDVAEDQVRRVPRAAHPHLEHAQADGLVGEPEIGDRGERLEV